MAKVVVTMPDDLLLEVDAVARKKRTNRSKFFRLALMQYLEEQKRKEFEALMVEGYREMAEEDLIDARAYLGAIDGLENPDHE